MTKIILTAMVLATFLFLQTPAHASVSQVSFLNDIADAVSGITEILNTADEHDSSTWPEAVSSFESLFIEIDSMELPEENTAMYDVLRYSSAQSVYCMILALDESISAKERESNISDGIQYLLVAAVILDNASLVMD